MAVFCGAPIDIIIIIIIFIIIIVIIIIVIIVIIIIIVYQYFFLFGGDWQGYHGLSPGLPYIDPTPDYVLISASESNGYTNLQFERETTTEEDDDPHDVQFRVGNIQRADLINVALDIGNWVLGVGLDKFCRENFKQNKRFF